MASTMFAAELSFGMTLFMLPRCVVAQVPFPPCVELSRRSREFQTCTEYVDRRLRRQPKEKAFGRWVAFYEGPLRRYPPEQYGLYRGRYCTTDRNFKANGDSLMSGYWTVHRKSGQLLVEDIYERGYL